MSSPVGTARVEITGDVTAFANKTESDLRSMFSNWDESFNAQFSALTEQFGTAGTSAGAALSEKLTSSTAAGADGLREQWGTAGTTAGEALTERLGASATEAQASLPEQWGAIGTAAGGAVIDSTSAAITDGGGVVDSAMQGLGTASGGGLADSLAASGADAGAAAIESTTSAIADGSGAVIAAVGDIATQVSDTSSDFGDAGSEAGDEFSSGLADSVDGSGSGGALTAIPDAIDQGKPLAIAAAAGLGSEAGTEASNELTEKGKEAGSKFGESLKESLKVAGSTVVAGGGLFGLAEFVKGSIEAADESQVAGVKIKNVFGEAAESIEAWSESAVHDLRETSDEAQLTAASYGQFFSSLGVGDAQSATMSEKFTTLTANVAAFNNVSQDTVQSAFSSALKGRTAALAALGIPVTASTLQHEALAHGITDSTTTMKDGLPVLSAQQKGLAAYYAILDNSTRQQDAMATSAGTARARQAEFSAEIGELQTRLGNDLLPVLSATTGLLLNDLVPAFTDLGHLIVENEGWLRPLAISLGVGAAAFVAVKLAVGGFNAVLGIGRAALALYSTVAGGVGSVLTTLGLRDAEVSTEMQVNQARLSIAQTESAGATARLEAASASLAAVQAEGAGSTDALAAANAELAAAATAAAAAADDLAVAEGAVDVAMDANPIGLVVGAVAALAAGLGFATHGFGMFGNNARSASAGVQAMTTAVQQDNDAIGTNTRTQAENNLAKAGAFTAATTLGISLKTVTDASLGNADAISTVTRMQNLGAQQGILYSGMTDKQRSHAIALGEANKTLSASLKTVTGDVKGGVTAAQQIAEANGKTTTTTTTATAAEKANAAAVAAQKAAVAALVTALQNLAQTQLAEAQSEDAYREGLLGVTAAVKTNGKSLSENTKGGLANRDMLLQLLGQTLSLANSQVKNGTSVDVASAALRRNVAQLEATATAAGLPKSAVNALVRQMGLTPHDITTKFHLNGVSSLVAQARSVQGLLREIANGTYTATVSLQVNAQNVGQAVHDAVNNIGSNAGGTDDWRGGLTWVGEKGPEILNLPPHSKITPNAESMAIAKRAPALATASSEAATADSSAGGGNERVEALLAHISQQLDQQTGALGGVGADLAGALTGVASGATLYGRTQPAGRTF